MSLFEAFERCILCGSDRLFPMKGYEQDYLVRCSSCYFVFCNRKPTIDELNVHYSMYPRMDAISDITLKRYNSLLDAFEPYRKTNNIIDVGCGDGFFLETARKRKWNVFGTEFTQEKIEACRQKGIQITTSPLDSNLYQAGFFDVVTSFEVIEHINTPQQELKSFDAVLRNGGVVYITTPNFNSISRSILKSKWNIIEYPEHLSYYTKQTLTLLFRNVILNALLLVHRVFQSTDLKQVLPLKIRLRFSLNADELLRQKAEDKAIFRLLKSSINLGLNITSKGDAIKALFEKQ
ncbi:MAG: class I SAM-dependent methyltransferase [Flammeovirgaceae bacterium]|nr:class I SAM-dependent methyltransferase [Flammeovirgaceae bacterium]